jgi:hypothetical protein
VRVLFIDLFAVVELNQVTISGGNAGGDYGGGIQNRGTLTLNNSTIRGENPGDNTADYGGGIYNLTKPAR